MEVRTRCSRGYANVLAAAVAMVAAAAAPGVRAAACRGIEEDMRARNAVYGEAGGPGLQYSLNYERHVSCRVFGRVGVSPYVPLPTTKVSLLHLQVGALLGGDAHNLELGLGASPTYSNRDNDDPLFHVVGTATVGYRYMSADSGLLFRAGFTPYIAPRRLGRDRSVFAPWFGLSFGWAF